MIRLALLFVFLLGCRDGSESRVKILLSNQEFYMKELSNCESNLDVMTRLNEVKDGVIDTCDKMLNLLKLRCELKEK